MSSSPACSLFLETNGFIFLCESPYPRGLSEMEHAGAAVVGMWRGTGAHSIQGLVTGCLIPHSPFSSPEQWRSLQRMPVLMQRLVFPPKTQTQMPLYVYILSNHFFFTLNTVDPWTTWVWTACSMCKFVFIYMWIFSINMLEKILEVCNSWRNSQMTCVT